MMLLLTSSVIRHTYLLWGYLCFLALVFVTLQLFVYLWRSLIKMFSKDLQLALYGLFLTKLAQLQPSRLFSSMPLMFALLVLPFQQTFLEFHVLHIVQCRPSLSFQLALQIEFWRREFSPYYWPVFKCSATYTLQLEPPPPPPVLKGGEEG